MQPTEKDHHCVTSPFPEMTIEYEFNKFYMLRDKTPRYDIDFEVYDKTEQCKQ